MHAFLLVKRAMQALLAVGLLVAAAAGYGQSWPNKPVRIILPFAAGGGGDTVMRPLSQRLSEALGQQVVLENIPGAGGALGMKAAQRAPADGYTFVMISNSHTILETLQPGLGYGLMKDFTPVAAMASLPLMLVVNPSVPVQNLQQFIAYAKSNPGKLSYATPGTGTVYHLVAEQFNHLAGIRMLHVPYKSSAVARTDLISGQVNVMFDGIATMKSFVDSGRVKALGLADSQKNANMSQLAPVSDVVPGFNEEIWVGMMAPVGTPQVAVDRMNVELVKLMGNPDIRKAYSEQSTVPVAGTQAAFGKMIRDDIAKWSKIIRIANVKASD